MKKRPMRIRTTIAIVGAVLAFAGTAAAVAVPGPAGVKVATGGSRWS